MKVVVIGFGSIGKRHVNNLLSLGILDVVLLRTSKNNLIQSRLKIILDNINIPTKIKLAVDVDPINFY